MLAELPSHVLAHIFRFNSLRASFHSFIHGVWLRKFRRHVLEDFSVLVDRACNDFLCSWGTNPVTGVYVDPECVSEVPFLMRALRWRYRLNLTVNASDKPD